MKNLSLILNGVLFVAVGILFYLQFSKPTTSTAGAEKNDSTKTPVSVELPEIRSVNGPIAFINQDTLSEKYKYIKDSKAQLKSYFDNKTNQLKQKAKQLQDEYLEFEKNAPALTQDIIAQRQEGFQRRQYELMQDEENLQTEIAKKQEDNYRDILKKVDDHLRELSREKNYSYVFTYSKGGPAVIVYANDSLEITNQVINGLNKAYKKK